MWRKLTALLTLALAAAAPALAQTASEPVMTGGAAPPTLPSAAPTGGVVAESTPAPAPAPAPQEPGPPQPAPQAVPEPASPPPLAPRASDDEMLAALAVTAQEEDPLQDLPQLAPPASPAPAPAPAPEEPQPQPQAEEPRLADTGLEALLLAYAGVALLTLGCATFAVLRKAQRLVDGRRT